MTGISAEYYRVKDSCREGLLAYLQKAVSLLPLPENPLILDIGCGTGVPTLWLAGNCGGKIIAVDIDRSAIEWLDKKIIERKLESRITTLNMSFFDMEQGAGSFDIVLAEGLLNITGFRQGFVRVISMIREGGFFVIHDEYKDHEKKCDFIKRNNCELRGTVYLDENVWWNQYYRQLDMYINSISSKHKRDLFSTESQEIELYRKDPSPFRSIYYVVKRL